MCSKREVLTNDSKVEKLIVYTNDKGNEFVQVVINLNGRLYYLCDFKQNDALLLQCYKMESMKK